MRRGNMGSTWSNGISESASVDVVNASADTVWSTLADIEAFPNYFSVVESVTILNEREDSRKRLFHENNNKNGCSKSVDENLLSKRNLRHGMAWEETRNYNGHLMTMRKRITSIETNQVCDEELSSSEYECQQRSVRVNVTLLSKLSDIANTYTLRVESAFPSSSTCRLVVSMAILPENNMFLHVAYFLGRRKHRMLNEKVKRMLLREVTEIAAEAERRQQILKLEEKISPNLSTANVPSLLATT